VYQNSDQAWTARHLRSGKMGPKNVKNLLGLSDVISATIRSEQSMTHSSTQLRNYSTAQRTHTKPSARCGGLQRFMKHPFAQGNGQLRSRLRCHDRNSSPEEQSSYPSSLASCDPSVAVAFAYLGDAIWELYARQHMILRSEKHSTLGSQPIILRPQEATKHGWCSSRAMCGHLARLLEDRVFTEEELAILKWGRDFGHETRSRHNCHHHREASALETLVAYLYLFNPGRLNSLISKLGMNPGNIVTDRVRSDMVTRGMHATNRQTGVHQRNVCFSDLQQRVCMLEQRLNVFEGQKKV